MVGSKIMLSSSLFIVLTLALPSLQQMDPDSPIVMDPVDTTAAVGTDAVFYCKVRTGNRVLVYWVEDRSIGIGPNVNENSAYPQYEIFGDPLLGYYNFRIKNVTAGDSGKRYDCVVIAHGRDSNYEAGAVLTVVEDARPPSGPTCQSVPSREFTVEEGDELSNYRCDTQGGIPLGELTWSLLRSDKSRVDVDSDVLATETSLEAVMSRYTVGPEDHESQIACSVSHPSLSADRSCYVPTSGKILVRHFPQVTFGPEIQVNYLESTTVTVRCSATAYPAISPTIPELTFSNPEKMITITYEEAGLIEATLDVSQDDVGERINCTATNIKGATTATIEIKLQPVLPSWLLITVLIIAVVLLFLFSLFCCYCCCNGCKGDEKPRDQPDLADTKAAGYDVNESRSSSMYKPNGLGHDHDPHPMGPADDGSFDEIPLNDYSDFPPTHQPETVVNDNETGEINDGYLTPDANERFPPKMEDEHLMDDKPLSTFQHSPNGDDETFPPPPPPLPLDLEQPNSIPIVEDD